MSTRKLAPIHPGEVLQAEFLEPLALSQYRLAQDLSVPPRRINEIVHGKRAISRAAFCRARRPNASLQPRGLDAHLRESPSTHRDHGAVAPN
jgi:addiction module antidote protein, HigA family